MIAIHENPTHTVGLMDGDNPPEDFQGTFDPKLLKLWINEIIQNFGDDKPVFISTHRSNDPKYSTAFMLSAASGYCDSLQECVCGFTNEKEKGGVKK